MITLINITLLSALFQNIIFTNALGTTLLPYAARNTVKKGETADTIAGVSPAVLRIRRIFGISGGIAFTAVVAGVFARLFDLGFAKGTYPENVINAVRPFVYMVIIGVVYTLCLVVVWRFIPKLYQAIHKYMHVSALNSAVIGTVYLCSSAGGGMLDYIGHGLGAGIGFACAAWLLAAAEQHLYGENTPPAFRGLPAVFMYLGLVALSLTVFG